MTDRRQRMKASELAKASSSDMKGHWVPPPGKTSRTAMAWEVSPNPAPPPTAARGWGGGGGEIVNFPSGLQGPTHRLEILPPVQGGGDTVLRMSDLAGDGDPADIIVVRRRPPYGWRGRGS